MRFSYFLLAIIALFAVASARIDPKNLKCLVCRTTFIELDKAIMKVDKWKKVDVGNFRMDASGNTMQDKVPAHRSSVYISELIDDICKKMDDYVRVYYKATGKLAIMKLIDDNGHMNADSSKTKFVTDDDLNKSLEYYCERLFEENEDEITDLYKKRPKDDVMPDAEAEICFKHTSYCEEWMLPTDMDTTWTPEMEAEYVKVHGSDPYGFNLGSNTGGGGAAPVDMSGLNPSGMEGMGGMGGMGGLRHIMDNEDYEDDEEEVENPEDHDEL